MTNDAAPYRAPPGNAVFIAHVFDGMSYSQKSLNSAPRLFTPPTTYTLLPIVKAVDLAFAVPGKFALDCHCAEAVVRKNNVYSNVNVTFMILLFFKVIGKSRK